jgi:hypothetical protein
VELYLYSLKRLHRVILNALSTGKSLNLDINIRYLSFLFKFCSQLPATLASLVLNLAQRHEDVRESGGIAPRNLNLGRIWK